MFEASLLSNSSLERERERERETRRCGATMFEASLLCGTMFEAALR